ncbi:MAG: hypothetical protein E6J63_22080 [Deltaproteobacteria bacterium]|nr:MAG: hypothetical protein E6J63_22080 [Deltaproteobacteria bacterium]
MASIGPGDSGDFDAAVGAVADAGDSGTVDAGTDAGDGGSAMQSDAGSPDSGMAFSPTVAADGGPMSLMVTTEPGSPCGDWLPQPADPEMMTVDTQYGFIWNEPVSNGRGDLGVALDGTFWEMGFISHGGISMQGTGGWITPQADNFLYVSNPQPCMICWPYLMTWPSGGKSLFLGTGYPPSTNCTFAPRPSGGVYTSCVGPGDDGGVVETFAKYDESLALLASGPGDGMDLVAADATDRIVESNAVKQLRWLDSNGAAITPFFASGTQLQRLIGGGFLDNTGQIIPSGSSATTPAPSWLTERSSVSIVLGGRGYALGSDKDCGLEIRDADGSLCGTLDFVNCRLPPRPGLDGTIALPLNAGGYFFVTSQTLAIWRGLLR